MKVFILSVCAIALLLMKAELVSCKPGDLEYKEIEEFLAEYEPKISEVEEHKDVVLVLGNTGDGKTTFTQWIAGDNSKLISIGVGKGTGEYIIVDNNRIGNSTIVSKTIYPELFVDKETETAYYDISGFGDSRGVKNDIATSYFIKRIIEKVNSIKVLLFVSYPSVRVAVDRKNLKRLLRHFTELLINSHRYLDGIGLIVTKVDNSVDTDDDGNFHLVSDELILSNIAAFLREVAAELQDQIEMQTVPPADIIFHRKSIEILHAIADSNEQRIALFRRPNKKGPLDKIPLLQDAKRKVQTIVSESLKFIPINNEDFGYTVSSETKIKLHDLIDSIQTDLKENFNALANNLYTYYEQIHNEIKHKIEHIDLQDITKVNIDVIAIQKLFDELKRVYPEIVKLVLKLKQMKHYKELPVAVKDTISNLNVNISQQIVSNITSPANFLDFLEDSLYLKFKSNTGLLVSATEKTGNDIAQLINNSELSINQLMVQIDNKIKGDIDSNIEALKQVTENYEKETRDLQEVQIKIKSFHDKIIDVNESNNRETNLLIFRQTLVMYGKPVSENFFKEIMDDKYFNIFMTKFYLFVVHIRDSIIWYKFLDMAYNKLSLYEIQNDKAARERCKTVIQLQNSAGYVGRRVQDTNIEAILRDCSLDLHNTEFELLKQMHLNQYKVTLLEDVINMTLNPYIHISQSCSEEKFLVKGRFVKLSDVNFQICNSFTHFQILATEKVFIDKDLDFTGHNVRVSVMSPIWEVVGNKKIVLDGSDGETIYPTRANRGQDGMPGRPGGNAGHFLGYGNEFINGDNLVISANGGDGSKGQDGGDGEPGKDGVVPDIAYKDFAYGLLEEETHHNVNYWLGKGFTVYQNSYYWCPIVARCLDYTVVGVPCSDGGSGGRGGAGGEGGQMGTVSVYSKAPFKITAKDGKGRAAGKHGTGASAGSASATITVHEARRCILIGKIKFYDLTGITYHHCQAGSTPCCSYNTSGKLLSVWNRPILKQIVFEEFRNYLQGDFQSTLRKSVLSRSLENLPSPQMLDSN